MAVVIVESPAKAKTINKYLGSAYKVLASYGHVRDLNDKRGSVDPDNKFSMKWQINPKSAKHISDIKLALAGDNHLILATDPDREGEAISWHLVEILKKQKSVTNDTKIQRIVFNAITKSAVLEAINNPRNLDVPLIEAYLARRALDYLLGYNMSPSLTKVGFGFQSAGRVQSPTLRLIVEREMEIESFKPVEYWSININLNYNKNKFFDAQGIEFKSTKIEKLTIDQKNTISEIFKSKNLKALATETNSAKKLELHKGIMEMSNIHNDSLLKEFGEGSKDEQISKMKEFLEDPEVGLKEMNKDDYLKLEKDDPEK